MLSRDDKKMNACACVYACGGIQQNCGGGGDGGRGSGILGRYNLSSSLAYTADTLTILFPVLFCTEEGHNAKIWRSAVLGVFGCRFVLN